MADTDVKERAAELFRQNGKRLEFLPGENLFNSALDQGGSFAHFLDSGSCSLSGFTRDGSEHIFLYFHGQRVVGFMQLMPIEFGGDPPHIVVTAKTPCVVYRVTREQFQGFLREESSFQTYMLQVVSENYLNLIKHYQSGQGQCATSRLCALLLDYAGREGDALCMPAYFNMAEFSRYLGVHTVTVSRIMVQLKQRGYIEKQGRRILLRDPEGLGRLIRDQSNFDF